MLWGTLSDIYGRRLIFLACLLVLALACVGLALVPTSAYWLLVLLRCFQAAGSASTIALGNRSLVCLETTDVGPAYTGAGVISDISTREERGGFFGLFILGPMVPNSRDVLPCSNSGLSGGTFNWTCVGRRYLGLPRLEVSLLDQHDDCIFTNL